MIHRIVASLALLAAAALAPVPAAAQLTPGQSARLDWVPNPRTRDASWVADPSGHLRPETVATLNAELSALEAETGHEIAVVVLDSLSGFEPGDVALALHRKWGVGKREQDDGIVLLWAPRDRAVHISVGYGLEGAIPDARAGRIRDREILAAFRREAYDAGILAGARALAAAAREETAAQGLKGEVPGAITQEERHGGSGDGGGVGRGAAIAGGVAGGLATLIGGTVARRRWRRRRPRPCPNGHGMMARVDDREDEAYLERGERMEETLRSVDHDVWRCALCGHQEKVAYRRWFTSYARCPACERRTLETITKTVVAATTSSTGMSRVTERCRNCRHTREYERVIPRVSASSSGGSSGGGGGGGGGSSFGGGSAGGGGAGGSY